MNVKQNFILISDQLHRFHIAMARQPQINNRLMNLALFFFNVEIKRKGPSHPSVTSTERRQQQNAGILESKGALFVVYKEE